MKTKLATILFALFLWWFGAHRFYLWQTWLWFLYLIFVWTFIPALVSIIDIIYFALMKKEDFDLRYNAEYIKNKDVINWISKNNQDLNNDNIREIYKYGKIDIIKLMTDSWQDLNDHRIIYLCKYGQIDIIKLMIENKIDIIKNFWLCSICWYEQINLVKMMIKNGDLEK